MTKSDLILKLADQNPHFYEQDVSRIVNVVLIEIMHALRDGARVELRGFGAFTTKPRAARRGRNPRTGTSVNVGAKRVPSFRSGKGLRDRLNGGKADTAASSSERIAEVQAPARSNQAK